MLSGKQEGLALKLNTVIFSAEPPQNDLAIRTPITDIPGDFSNIEEAIVAAKIAADSFPAATWIVIEDDQNVEHARLCLDNGIWEKQ